MYNNKTVSVCMSTYNEKDSLRQCINDFFATGVVDEVIVVNNNAAEGTDEEVLKTKAKLIHEPKQGYGHGFQRAMAEATGDYLVLCEPDGTFTPGDIHKLLAYTDCMEVVQGSRTSSTMILSGANMGIHLKYGNYFVAKIAEFAFAESAPNLSDCGCTFRLLTREAYESLKPYFRCGKSAFGLELSLLALRMKLHMCQIPLRYGERVGESMVTGSLWKTFVLGFYMMYLIFQHRIESFFHPIQRPS